MSRKSLKKQEKTTKATSSVSRVSKRAVVVFDSTKSQTVKDTVLLYRIVFKTKQASLLALFFCVCFLSQPFQNVYANEAVEPVTSAEPEPIVIVEEVEPIVLESGVETQVSAEENQELPTEETTVAEEIIPVDEPTSLPNLINPDSALESETENETETPNASDTVELSKEVTESVDTEISNDNVVATTVSSSSDSEGQFIQNLHVVATVESDSAYSFSRDECTRIEDGSFYCHDRAEKEIIDDTLIAAPDADGDLEIYLIRDGEQLQVTNNNYDDASPYYDDKSKTIVWHRLLNDRYQIISFNPDTGEELQLTMGEVNNMEPTRQGEVIVWQRWVENNWEIILYDGEQELQITDSSEHDTAPHIRGSLIIWNSRTLSGEQTLKTYDIENKSFTTIADSDGVSVSNPRMMVMYEALYENGDVVMKGFDLVTGEVIPLNALPREVPDEIPSTDTTGETRALIQNKPTVRDSVITNSSTTPPSTPPLPEIEPGTLDLRISTTSEPAAAVQNELETIPALVIPPLLSSE